MAIEHRGRSAAGRVKSPRLRLYTQMVATGALLLVCGSSLQAASTEPRLALMRAIAYRSAGGSITLKLEGSLSFADALQLGLPLNVVITQGTLNARFDLAGNVFTSAAGGPEESAPGPGVVSIGTREIVLVLPAGFTAGAATAQLVASYSSQPIASNRLEFGL
jgi:hypothetical protein